MQTNLIENARNCDIEKQNLLAEHKDKLNQLEVLYEKSEASVKEMKVN